MLAAQQRQVGKKKAQIYLLSQAPRPTTQTQIDHFGFQSIIFGLFRKFVSLLVNRVLLVLWWILQVELDGSWHTWMDVISGWHEADASSSDVGNGLPDYTMRVSLTMNRIMRWSEGAEAQQLRSGVHSGRSREASIPSTSNPHSTHTTLRSSSGQWGFVSIAAALWFNSPSRACQLTWVLPSGSTYEYEPSTTFVPSPSSAILMLFDVLYPNL
jgi:hypothetical protein